MACLLPFESFILLSMNHLFVLPFFMFSLKVRNQSPRSRIITQVLLGPPRCAISSEYHYFEPLDKLFLS